MQNLKYYWLCTNVQNSKRLHRLQSFGYWALRLLSQSVAQTSLKVAMWARLTQRDPAVSASWVLGQKACTTIPDPQPGFLMSSHICMRAHTHVCVCAHTFSHILYRQVVDKCVCLPCIPAPLLWAILFGGLLIRGSWLIQDRHMLTLHRVLRGWKVSAVADDES